MKSIRGYLLSRLLVWAGLVLCSAAALVFLLVRASIGEQFDRVLADRIQGLASILFQVKDEVSFEFSEELMPEYASSERPAYFELWYEDGELLERSPALGTADLDLAGDIGESVRYWDGSLPDGHAGRYAARRLEVHHVFPEEGPDRPQAARLLVVVARDRAELAAAERRLLVACAATVLVLLVVLGLLARHTVAEGLAPARRLARALGAIDLARLPSGLALGELPEELEPMARTSDALIRRVEQALERERRTTADIAHELRTPIAELLTVAEVALRNGKDGLHDHKPMTTIRNVADRMGVTVSTLLQLARLESGVASFAPEECELERLVQEILSPQRALIGERGLELVLELPSGTRVPAPTEVTRIVLSNLIQNALHHAPARGRVEIRLERTGPAWCLLVANAAEQLVEEDLERLAEPFWRKDPARAGGRHAGLGLALASALAGRAGLELRFSLTGTLFQARLQPVGPPPRAT